MDELFKINGNSSGVINDVFSTNELCDIEKKLLLVQNSYKTEIGNYFTGIGIDHPLYSWFCKKVFNKIKIYVEKDIKLLFGALLQSNKPYGVHSDYYHKKYGEPFMAFLIPLSLDNNHNVTKTHTIIFNEVDKYVAAEEPNKKSNIMNWDNFPILQNNALNFHESLLSHIKPEHLQKLSIQNILQWKLGSVLFWDEKLLHCSDNYVANGAKLKHALVLHTYINP